MHNISGAIGRCGEVWFSHKRGFYDTGFQLILSTADKDAEIYYKIDGSRPTINDGFIYKSPLNVNETTTIRAVAVKPGWLDSRIETHTYMLESSTAVKSLPIISIATDEENLYDPNIGIVANPLGRGFEWERPTSMEVLYPHDNTGFQENCGIRLHGSTYRRNRININSKVSFRLYFRGLYGESWLTYPLIPHAPVSRYKFVVLRSGYNDPTNPFIKDELGRRLHKDMGSHISNGINVNLFINGKYKGYYNPVERISEEMLQEHYDSETEWDVV
jgi:hypothetical protein